MIANIYKRLLQIGKVAGSLTFLFGIPYGIIQYTEAKQDHRVSQTIDLFKQFNSTPFTIYREHVLGALSEYKTQIAAAARNEDDLKKVTLVMIDKRAIETDLLLLMDFFDGVTVCVITELCDADTTEKLFSGRARELYINFFNYIDLQRNTIAGAKFGIGLETVALAKPRKSKWPLASWFSWL